MELSELILQVLDGAVDAVGRFSKGDKVLAAESLAGVANKITKELPSIKLKRDPTPEQGGF